MPDNGRVLQNLGWIIFALALLLVYQLRIALIPFFIAFAFAYVTIPLVDLLERQMPRTWAALMVFFVFFLGGLLVLVVVGTSLVNQIQNLVENLFTFFENFDLGKTFPWLKPYLPSLQLDPKTVISSLSGVVGQGLKAAGSLAFILLSLLVIPIYSFYLLRDGHHLVSDLKHMLPSQNRAELLSFFSEMNTILRNFIQGQLLISSLNGVVAVIGLSILGVRNALLIGVFWGIASIVPFVGHGLGVTFSLIMAWITHGRLSALLGVAAVFLSVQGLENYVWIPRIMGHKLHIHPLLVVLSIVVWGVLLGFLGVLLAVPITAILEVLYRRLTRPETAGA